MFLFIHHLFADIQSPLSFKCSERETYTYNILWLSIHCLIHFFILFFSNLFQAHWINILLGIFPCDALPGLFLNHFQFLLISAVFCLESGLQQMKHILHWSEVRWLICKSLCLTTWLYNKGILLCCIVLKLGNYITSATGPTPSTQYGWEHTFNLVTPTPILEIWVFLIIRPTINLIMRFQRCNIFC